MNSKKNEITDDFNNFKIGITELFETIKKSNNYEKLLEHNVLGILEKYPALRKIEKIIFSKEFINALNEKNYEKMIKILNRSFSIDECTNPQGFVLFDNFVIVDSNVAVEFQAAVGESYVAGTKLAVLANAAVANNAVVVVNAIASGCASNENK